MAKNKLTVGKMVYTVTWVAGPVVSIDGDNVTINSMFGDCVVNRDEVYHSMAKAWHASRAV